MSGTFENLHVPPTLVSFAVAPGSAEAVISPEFKAAGHELCYLPYRQGNASCRRLNTALCG